MSNVTIKLPSRQKEKSITPLIVANERETEKLKCSFTTGTRMCWNETKRDGHESVDSITQAFELKLELSCKQSADVKLTKECVAAY